MILVTNAQYGDIIFEGDSDTISVKFYVELKNLPEISHQDEETGLWILIDGTELETIYSDDYFEVRNNA